MKRYIARCLMILILEILIVVICNMIVMRNIQENRVNEYKLEVRSVMNELENTAYENIDISKYPSIIAIRPFDKDEICNRKYVVEYNDRDACLYRIEYTDYEQLDELVLCMNTAAVLLILISVVLMFTTYVSIISPFNKFEDLPIELSKGNLIMPIKENRNKYFGRFLWGMNLLRERLEESKNEELRLQKEKKTLVLSLSHDIKTPLSSIKLYGKAISENLYEDDRRRNEAYATILANANQIEKYVNEIIEASQEDFLYLSVNCQELFLSEVLDSIKEYYSDRLVLFHTEFVVEAYANCLVKADKDRLIEVIQNIIENGIKYGDGKRISVFVSEEEDCKLIHIENTGEPINEQERLLIFDSFYRGSNSKDKKGNGLGLYICKKLMHLMDGEVFLDSERENTSFVLVVRKL